VAGERTTSSIGSHLKAFFAQSRRLISDATTSHGHRVGIAGKHPGSRVHLNVAQVVLEKTNADSASDLVLCIDIDGSDPSADFLNQLQWPGRIIVGRSKCHGATDAGPHSSYFGAMRRPAHFLTVSDVIQIFQSDLTV